MARRIGKSMRKGSKNHKQQTGYRGRMHRFGNRTEQIDAAVDEAQTGKSNRRRGEY
jgi:hypothetical protein